MRIVSAESSPTDRLDITITDRPKVMPKEAEGRLLVCEYVYSPEDSSRTLVFICDSVKDMQHLFDSHAKGDVAELNWYVTSELTRILVGEEFTRWLHGKA